MEKSQNKRYKKTKKIVNNDVIVKKETQLKPIYKFLIVFGLFVLCIAAIVGVVIVLVQKYHG